MKVRLPVCVLAFSFTAGAIAWGVLSDSREARLQAFLTSIEAAEDEVPYMGTRIMGGSGPDTVKLRIWSRDGRKRVDFLGFDGTVKTPGRASGPRAPFGGGLLPVFLRPGHDQWKRKVKDAALAVRNYEIAVTGRDFVAGRECEVVEIRARFDGRPSYRVATDVENRFPLRFEVLSTGQRVFETHFADIEYRPFLPEGTFDNRRRMDWLKMSQEEVAADRIGTAAGFHVLRPTYLPKGFELRGSELIRVNAELSKELSETIRPFLPFPIPKLDARVAHLTYTDGLAAVALVECSSTSDLWQYLKKFIPPSGAGASATEGKPGSPTAGIGKSVIARKLSDRGGSAYLLEVEGTVVLAAGNVASEEIESLIRTLEWR
jgi:negative regulator of sigma E activity